MAGSVTGMILGMSGKRQYCGRRQDRRCMIDSKAL